MRVFAALLTVLGLAGCAPRPAPVDAFLEELRQEDLAAAEWRRFALAVQAHSYAEAERSLGKTMQCSGALSGEQRGYWLLTSDPEGILCLLETTDLSAAALTRPHADTVSALARGRVTAVFAARGVVVVRAQRLRFTAAQ